MGTPQERLKVEADKSVGRLLKEGSNGSLTRAKETLKDRLYQQMIEEVQGELEATDEVAQHALEDASVDWDAVMQEAKEALKKQLMMRMIQQALDEVTQELEDTDRLAEEALKEAPSHPDALERIKDAMKERLMAEMLEEAIAEIQDEVESADERADQMPDSEADPADDEDEAVDELVAVEEDEPSPSAMMVEEEEADLLIAPVLDPDGQPLIDMHFWNDDEDTETDLATSGPIESVMEASEELDAEPDFFPQDVVAELGENFGDGSSAEVAPDKTPISFLAGFSLTDKVLEAMGDGASHKVEANDSVEERIEEPAEALETEEASEEEEAVCMVYGVFSSSTIIDENSLPSAGIDPNYPLTVVNVGRLGAIMSIVDNDMFGAGALAANQEDPNWKEASLLTYESLVDDCSEIEGFVPVPFGSVYQNQEMLYQALEQLESIGTLAHVQDRSDWTVRVYRNRDTLHQRIMERSQTVQDIMVEIKSKPKGEAAEIKKRMVSSIQEEISETTDRCTSDVHEQLLAHVDDARLGTPDRKGHADKGEGIFDATYLVHKDRELDFHTDLEALSRDYDDLGFHMDVTGPITPLLHLPTVHPAFN